MARPVSLIIILVIASSLTYMGSQHAEAVSMQSENEEIEVVVEKGSDATDTSLKSLKRTPRSKLVFEIVINLGKEKKRKKGKKSFQRKNRKSSKRRGKNRRNHHRVSRHKHKARWNQRKRHGSTRKNNNRRRHRNHYHVIRNKNKRNHLKRNKKKGHYKKRRKSNNLVRHGNHFHQRHSRKRDKGNKMIRRYYKKRFQKKKPHCSRSRDRRVKARSWYSRRNKENWRNTRKHC